MLLFNVEKAEPISRLTLALSPGEALEVIEKLSYLLRKPDYHHDHVEDFPNQGVLDLLVIQPDALDSYDPELKEAIKRLR